MKPWIICLPTSTSEKLEKASLACPRRSPMAPSREPTVCGTAWAMPRKRLKAAAVIWPMSVGMYETTDPMSDARAEMADGSTCGRARAMPRKRLTAAARTWPMKVGRDEVSPPITTGRAATSAGST